jgi:hypothetical protein
MSGFQV